MRRDSRAIARIDAAATWSTSPIPFLLTAGYQALEDDPDLLLKCYTLHDEVNADVIDAEREDCNVVMTMVCCFSLALGSSCLSCLVGEMMYISPLGKKLRKKKPTYTGSDRKASSYHCTTALAELARNIM